MHATGKKDKAISLTLPLKLIAKRDCVHMPITDEILVNCYALTNQNTDKQIHSVLIDREYHFD